MKEINAGYLQAIVYDNHLVTVKTCGGTCETTVTFKQFSDWAYAVMAECLRISLMTMGGWIS